MSGIDAITLAIIIFTVIFSYKGFNIPSFFNRYKFEVNAILRQKDYVRLVSSGFLHVNWMHLIFNLVSLYAFSGSLQFFLGVPAYLFIFFSSLIGGNLLALFLHKKEGNYSSVGASGAICGIIFASIALFPGMSISFFGAPLAIPGWIFGLAFVLISIYGIRSRSGDIGHDAHLGGALVGMLVAIVLKPDALAANYVTILAIAAPVIIFIYLIIKRPQLLLVKDTFFNAGTEKLTIDQRYNIEKKSKQVQVDQILEKIHHHGMNSLSKKEKEILDEYSRSAK